MVRNPKKWFKFIHGGKGSKQTHAHLRTNAHGEIEFQCGLQRHMDDTIHAPRGSKKCPACVRYLKQKTKPQKESPLMPKKKVDSAQLLQTMIDTMCHWTGEDIAEKAEEVLGHKVKYLGDDLYEIQEN